MHFCFACPCEDDARVTVAQAIPQSGACQRLEYDAGPMLGETTKEGLKLDKEEFGGIFANLGVQVTVMSPLPIEVEGLDAISSPNCWDMPAEQVVLEFPGFAGVVPTEEVPLQRCKWDLFLSHLQRNAQDAVISLQMFLKQSYPGLRCFVDLEVDMKGNLEQTLYNGVANSKAFLFFITDGVLTSPWCLKEIRWAVEMRKTIVLVRETDARHGGLDMNAFLQQVPPDLQHVFRNNIAIPWHREPQYRDVSVNAIFKAAGLVDTYNQDMNELDKAKRRLQIVFVNGQTRVNAIDVIQDNSKLMRIVFFLGGFSHFKRTWVDWIYVFVFNLSFFFCGVLCTANLVYQSVPYHVISTDALTAYVHLPAWQSWRRWRIFVSSQECEELLTAVTEHPGNSDWIYFVCHFGGMLIMMLQMVMVGVVLGGFSLPYDALAGDVQLQHWHLGKQHIYQNQFTALHSRAMWIVIPPVITSMFCSYTMFAFVALLHLLHIRALRDNITECANIVARFQMKQDPKAKVSSKMREAVNTSSKRAGEEDDTGTEFSLHSAGCASEKDWRDVQATLLRMTMETHLFKTITELLSMAVAKTQRYIDNTCSQVSWLWVHLVFFSTCQVLAVIRAAQWHVIGVLKGVQYRWWWGLQDLFHFGGGLVLLCAAMGVFCVVTSVLQSVPRFAVEALQGAGCPPDRLGVISGMLKSVALGMHVFGGSVCVDTPKAVGFFFVILVIVLNAAISILGSLSLMP